MSVGKSLLWCLNKFWLAVAIILVIAAVLMSVLRYALPHIPDVSAQLEQQLEERLQQPVNIQQLAMSWHRQGPALDVTGVTLMGQENSPVTVDVDEISVVLDFWQSLLQQQLVAQEFILDNATVDVDLRELQQSGSDDFAFDTIERLFLQQLQRFSLTSSQVNVTNLAGERRSILIERLSWMNQGERHQGVGQFRVLDVTRNSLDFVVQLQGNQISTIDGQFYVDAREVDISPWLEQQLGSLTIEQAKANFTSWVSWRDGAIAEGLVQLRDNTVKATRGADAWTLQIPDGQVVLEPSQDGWLMNVQPFELNINGRSVSLPLIAWQSQAKQHQLSVQQLPIMQLLPIAELISPTLHPLIEWQQRTNTTAKVDLRYQYNGADDMFWQIESTDLASDGDGSTPSFSPLAIRASGDLDRGDWSVVSNDLTLRSERLSTEAPWTVDTLDLAGSWQRFDNGWQARLKQGSIAIADVNLALQARLKQQAEQPLTLALHGYSTGPFAVSSARKLLPATMGANTKGYLTRSLQAGQVSGLEVLWREPLNDFPNDSMASVFNGRVDIKQLDFAFQPDWPALQQVPIRLDFYQRGLHMFTDGGQLKNVDVGAVKASIPDLLDSAQGLQIQAQVATDAEKLYPVFAASPLNSVTQALEQVNPAGPITGQFELDIPFDGSRPVGVDVSAELSGSRINVDAIDQAFAINQGQLSIHNAEVTTDNLVLSWYGSPIKTQIDGKQRDDGSYQLTVDTAIDWQLEPLLKSVPNSGWNKYFYGAINGTGQLQLLLDGGVQSTWQSQYDLTGLESNLPAPLTKDFGENWQLTVGVSGDDEQLDMRIAVDDKLQWHSRWQPSGSDWDLARLHFGAENNDSPQSSATDSRPSDDFIISGQLPQVNVSEWYDLIYFLQQQTIASDGETGTDADASSFSMVPDYIAVTTPLLSWAGQQFTQANLNIWRQDAIWNGRVYAEDLSLEVKLPDNFKAAPIQVDADFIQLSSDLDLSAENNLREKEEQWDWVARLPAIEVTCKTCKLDDKTFNDLAARLAPIAGGIELQRLTTTSHNSSLDASGYWLVDEGNAYTQLSGELHSDDFGDLLRDYGLETAIRDSEASVQFGVFWQDHPHRLDKDTLGGSLQWQLGQGYLAEVSDGGARLFSLLSLDGILRKLTLDFRDIFSQGMFYTELGGSVQVANGIASTRDTELLGSAGNMQITGTTNLATEALDYQLTYAPKVTSSLPVILAWMVNPPSGLAALLLDKVLQDAEVISQLRYQVSGTISEPVVTEVERDSRPVDLPQLKDSQEEPNATTTDSHSTEQPSAPATKPSNG